MATNRALSFGLSALLADKEAAYEFLSEYTGLELADGIRELRGRHGVTQSQLAEILGTTQSAIARLEDNGYRKYSLATLQKVAKAFNAWPTVIFEPCDRVLARIVVGDEAVPHVALEPVTDDESAGLNWPVNVGIGRQSLTWETRTTTGQEQNTSQEYALTK